jgi:hypothetical protein
MTPAPRLVLLKIAGTLAYRGLTILGGGGFLSAEGAD